MKTVITLSAVFCILAPTAATAADPFDLPLYFIENHGQVEEEVSYYMKGADKTLYFTSRGVTIALLKEEGEIKRWATKLEFVDADPSVEPEGEDRRKAVFNYFKGRQEDWKTNIPAYGRLVYEELWPGIDLVYTGAANRLKYNFIVKPGADPRKIRLAYRGVTRLAVKETGELEVSTPIAEFEDGAPCAYQILDGERRDVPVRYSNPDETGNGSFTFDFVTGAYDPREPLIIDPAVIVYCGYFGGKTLDNLKNVVVDDEGNAYVAGVAGSTEATFPVKVGPDLTYNGGFSDVFVAKVNAQGTDLVYCGYIGGQKWETVFSLDIDDAGNAYVAGWTESTESSFPVKGGPDLTYNGGGFDVYVAKVNAQGTDLVYCGYIGGNNEDKCEGVAVDGAGNAYLVGWTLSTQTSFPVKGGPDLTYNGKNDGFVAKVNVQGTDLVYCGYIGGGLDDKCMGIAVDDDGQAFVSGNTASSQSTFPVKVGPDLTYNGGHPDVFVAKVNAQGTALEYCGYIGGYNIDECEGIALDDAGNVYVTGETESKASTFPVKVGPGLRYNGGPYIGGGDAFVARVNAFGTDLDYCGYIGGKEQDRGTDIAVDGEGRAYIVGTTGTRQPGFPVKGGPDLTYNGGMTDNFVCRVSALGAGLDFCGFVGGKAPDYAGGIALDNENNVYITGGTNSDETTFPVKTGPDLTYNGDTDGFIAKISFLTLAADPETLPAGTGGQVEFTIDAGLDQAGRQFLLLGSMSGTQPGTTLPGGLKTLPLNVDAFTLLVFSLLNTPTFQNFQGTLDGSGQASALLDSRGSLPSGLVGTMLNFAYTAFYPYDFVSNPVAVEIVP